MGKVITLEEFLSPPLTIIECRVYRGPNIHSQKPMIRIQADIGALEEWPTNRLPGFTEKLLELLPSLSEHTCSLGKPGGFLMRLKEGTWMGHVIEHIAIELQVLAGMDVTRGKTRSVKGKERHYNIMYSYIHEEAGLCAGRIALDLVASLLKPPFTPFEDVKKVHSFECKNGFDLNEALVELKRLAKKEKLGPTAQALVDEAEKRGIPWFKLDDQSLVQLGTGKHRKMIRASITSITSSIAVETASDKELTKKLLSEAAIPVPIGDVVRSPEDAVRAAYEIGFPVAVKPLDGNHGRGVTTDLHCQESVALAFTQAREHSEDVIVEKHFSGRDYRVLVINGEVIAAAERVPAHVVGNGVDTVAALIGQVNADPRRGDGHEDVMTRIEINDMLKNWLSRSNLTLESIPAKNQYVVLTPTANLSTGATAIDRTDEIHPDNACIARRAALTVGLDVAGIDIILPDISHSWRETGGGIVEVNASPGFRMHLHPAQGQARNVAKNVLSTLFPDGEKTHIPVIAVTGTNGKSTTVRMLAHILRESGMRVGFTSTSGIFVNDECIWQGDASGPKSARILLQDPTIDIAILETARGGILREGLGVMNVDVGVILNITADHLGLGGVETLEDLAEVKSIVVKAVAANGISVLNADNLHTLQMANNAGGNICYFSMSGAVTGRLLEHIASNGHVVSRDIFEDKMQIMLYRDGKRIPIIAIDDIPATFGGAATFNIKNALAATAIASGLNIDVDIIRTALASFTSSFEQNPGRFNIYDGHGFRVIMDYAHNPAALSAFFKMVGEMRSGYSRVIGNISVPGDRRDEDIREAGRIACGELDLVVFSENPDRRGRHPGEINAILSEGAYSVDHKQDRIICVSEEEEAIATCLEMAQPGDLIILFSGSPEETWKKVLAFKPSFTSQPEYQLYPYQESLIHA
jgi:cyanophycin synthetase